MKCPECNKEMELGFLQGMRRVAWVKKPHKISLLPKQGEVMLANNVIKDFTFRAWICQECKKIVFDYADEEI